MKNRLHDAFHKPETQVYRYVQGTIWALILLSILLLVVESLLPDESPADPIVRWADWVLLVIFAVEIILRVVTFQPPSLEVYKSPPLGRLRTQILGRLRYLVRPIMLVDIMAVLALFPEMRGLRALRLLRLLRTSRVFRYRNPFAIILRAFEESQLLFTLAFSILGLATLLGGITIYLVEAKTNPAIDSLFDGIWWALVTITTVGYGDITPITILGRIIGAVLMVSGMFTLAMFAGIVGSSLVSGMLSIREEQFRMSEYVNHVIVCGYDESTHLLLSALKLESALMSKRVVIFDNHERPPELSPDFIWVQGDPTKESELEKVRIGQATAVIVTGERDTTPQVADARTILITFTIRSYLENNRQQIRDRIAPLYVVTEILDSENVNHARTAGADEVIETRKLGYSMVAHAVAYHGTATALSGVIVSGSHSVYIGVIPEEYKEPISFGELMVKLKLSEKGGLVIGLRTPTCQEVINPDKGYMVPQGTCLLYLAKEPLLEPPG